MFPADLLDLRHHGGVVRGVGRDEPLVHHLHEGWGLLLDGRLSFIFLPVIAGLISRRGIILFDELVNPSPVACYPLLINLLLISLQS